MKTYLLTATIFLCGVAGLGAQRPVSIEGVWKIAERITPGGNPRANGTGVGQNNPRSSLLIFTKRYYREVTEMGGEPRPHVAAPADPQHLTALSLEPHESCARFARSTFRRRHDP
jgi:hypothetical protein